MLKLTRAKLAGNSKHVQWAVEQGQTVKQHLERGSGSSGLALGWTRSIKALPLSLRHPHSDEDQLKGISRSRAAIFQGLLAPPCFTDVLSSPSQRDLFYG